MKTALTWLVIEALIPLFGTSLIYIAFGVARKVVHAKGKPFKWEWREAADSMGWLYGGAILAMQDAMKAKDSNTLLHSGQVRLRSGLRGAPWWYVVLSSLPRCSSVAKMQTGSQPAACLPRHAF
ncbi:hypothetical protein [Candidatus Burkholderia verschuerenii]|uniref:hypothetical protein n=1 Tax=Candidatus Burkholderia verschuerenii TaxID=242163 RepID=UPI00067C6214|nr:hypothetical protein [Candidatus Burkholderia verschuerenii]